MMIKRCGKMKAFFFALGSSLDRFVSCNWCLPKSRNATLYVAWIKPVPITYSWDEINLLWRLETLCLCFFLRRYTCKFCHQITSAHVQLQKL